MDSNERRSKVPAGTFRASSHPPPVQGSEEVPVAPPPAPPAAASARPAAKPPAPPAAATAVKRRERVGTLSGHPPSIEPPSEIEGRAKFMSTLVGVTPSHAPPAPAGPVLAPPPWRGASAYQGGQEPQPRVSSISSPGMIPGVLADGTVAHPDDRRVPHTRITAAAPPAPSPEIEEVAPATAAIGDAIQQLLDAQASVSMEGVQESSQDITASSPASALGDDEELLRDSALEPVRESQIEVVRDSAIEAELPAEPVRSLPPAAPVAKRAAATEPVERPRVEPSAVPEPRATPPSARWASTPSPVVAPAPVAEKLSDKELASYSFVEGEAERGEESVAPAERPQPSPPETDGANYRLGLMVAAAILVAGVGGWAATRGGFVKPARTPAAAPAIAAPPPSALAPTQAPAVPAAAPELGDVAPAEPAAPVATAAAAAATKEPAPAAPAPVARPVAARPPRAPKSPAAAPDEPAAAQPVLSVTPRAPEAEPAPQAAPQPEEAPAGPLPETPTRENVQSALDAKRSEVLACAAGQRGVAEVDLTVSSSGAVTHAVVGGDFAGSPAGSCIARVVRTARFAPFSKPRFRVIYPFSL